MNPDDTLQDQGEDQQALDELNSGFDVPQTPPPADKPPSGAEEKKEPPKTEDAKEEETPPPADAPAPKPEYVQITKEELEALRSDAAKAPELEKQMRKAFGSIGNIQAAINRLQESTPKGIEIELPADVVSEMEAEFPEIADHLRKALGKALKGIRGTGGEKGTGLDAEGIRKLVSEAAIASETEALEDAHPNWKEIVGVPDEKGNINPEHPFRKWLATQPAEYQQKINSTNSSAVISRAIDKFQQATAKPVSPAPKPDPQADGRRNRLKDAVQPKGSGGPPNPAKSDDDEFALGFASG